MKRSALYFAGYVMPDGSVTLTRVEKEHEHEPGKYPFTIISQPKVDPQNADPTLAQFHEPIEDDEDK